MGEFPPLSVIQWGIFQIYGYLSTVDNNFFSFQNFTHTRMYSGPSILRPPLGPWNVVLYDRWSTVSCFGSSPLACIGFRRSWSLPSQWHICWLWRSGCVLPHIPWVILGEHFGFCKAMQRSSSIPPASEFCEDNTLVFDSVSVGLGRFSGIRLLLSHMPGCCTSLCADSLPPLSCWVWLVPWISLIGWGMQLSCLTEVVGPYIAGWLTLVSWGCSCRVGWSTSRFRSSCKLHLTESWFQYLSHVIITYS